MSKSIAVKRLAKEYKDVQKNPDTLIEVRFDEDNMLNIYYLLSGSPDTLYEGGSYFGCIKVKDNYPFAPPSIMMITPNGRFVENTRICLSMSDFHPESWNPAWTATRTIPMALLSFMNSDERSTGCVTTSDETKKIYAKRSMEWNSKNLIFKKVFGDKISEYETQKLAREENSKKAKISTLKSSEKASKDDKTSSAESEHTDLNLRSEGDEDAKVIEADSEDSIRIKQSSTDKTPQQNENSNQKVLFFGGLLLATLFAVLAQKYIYKD